MNLRYQVRPTEILLVEDSLLDIKLTQEALLSTRIKYNLHVVTDGEDALDFVRKIGQYIDVPRPDLILLDLNLPRKDGREVLAEMKADPDLKSIPIVVLSTSKAEEDIVHTYKMHVNCYIIKPVDMNEFIDAVKAISKFWMSLAALPK